VPVAVSVTCNVAFLSPVCVGINTTPITQTAWAFKVAELKHSVFPGALKVN